jgi:SAM-dependent methyltransferase
MSIDPNLYPDSYFDGLHRVTRFAATERKWRERDRDILRLALPSKEKSIVDLGSARGDVCFLLSPLVREAIGVDASPTAVRIASEEAARRGLRNVRFAESDVAECAGIPDRSVDVAAAMDLVEHIDDATVRLMLRACRRILKPGGFLAAYSPNREHYVERLKAHNFILKQFPEHIAVRRPRELVALFERERFRVTDLDYSVSPFPLVRHVERLLAPIPGIGRLFRYRILIRAEPA